MTLAKIETRLFVESDLAEGAVLDLDQNQAHFLRTVLRLKPGAELALFNGRDGEWQACIEALGKGKGTLLATAQRRVQTRVSDLWLVFAPIKRARLDFMIEKATELGVTRLQPVLTRHTNVGRVNLDRMAATAREAAEQSERLTVPEVREPLDLGRLLDGWPDDRRLLLAAEAGTAQPLAAALLEMKEPGGTGPLAVMTGPEGGFAESELDALRNLPIVTAIGLGPRILRADTAALAALACCQAISGDGAERPPQRA